MSTTSKSPRRPTRRPARRSFGRVRMEKSGRYAAHYLDPTTKARVAAPHTFATYADDWLATVRADVPRGVHRSPAVGSITMAEYFTWWLSQRPDLAGATRDQYATQRRLYLDRELDRRPVTGAAGIPRSGSARSGWRERPQVSGDSHKE